MSTLTEVPGNRLATRSRHTVACLVFLACIGTFASPALAQRVRRADDSTIELPPPPNERPTVRAAEVYVGFVVPYSNRSMCPSGSECVMGSGGQLGFSYEWRRRHGLALGIGYDLSILGGGTLWSAGTMQNVSFSGRYLFLPTRAIHPFIGFGVGGLLFGNLFSVSTAGGSADARFGVELEVTDSLAVTLAVNTRAIVTAPFTTSTDGVQRARHGEPNVLGAFQVGLVLVPTAFR